MCQFQFRTDCVNDQWSICTHGIWAIFHLLPGIHMPFAYPGIRVGSDTESNSPSHVWKVLFSVFWIPLGRSRKAINWHTSSCWVLNFFRNPSSNADSLWNNCSLYPTYHWIWGPLCQPRSGWSVGELAPNPIQVSIFCTTFSTNCSRLWFLGSQHWRIDQHTRERLGLGLLLG